MIKETALILIVKITGASSVRNSFFLVCFVEDSIDLSDLESLKSRFVSSSYQLALNEWGTAVQIAGIAAGDLKRHGRNVVRKAIEIDLTGAVVYALSQKGLRKEGGT